MKLFPQSISETLEFDKIVKILIDECMGNLGQVYFEQLQFETDKCVIESKLDEVTEMKRSLLSDDPITLIAYFDVLDDLKMLEIEGYVLAIEALQRINIVLRIASKIYNYLNLSRQSVFPELFKIIRDCPFDVTLQKEIIRVIDEEGAIKSDASVELGKIRSQIASSQRELDRVFKNCIQDFRNKGLLADSIESVRNGRRVLSVPIENKRKIRGVIHDESATGKTAFIEPELVIEINNAITELEQSEKREIYRILKELSAKLRPYVAIIRMYQASIVRFDVIHAKARLAISLKANKPILVDHPKYSITNAFHPLLYLKNKSSGKHTVPFNYILNGKNRIVVISGPNAGGKSVTLKAIGLNQMMLQAGMLIPVDPLSEIGLFEQIFADIGDQQSLEDELSTYSSRLQNARQFVEEADDKTLVLIDEFGSGTDPKMGGAIAEGILKELSQKGSFAVITTHFGNLKMFAFKTSGILNGCMNFDTETLSPTYELIIGRPGSSFAFEIATKNGLQQSIIDYAKQRIGKNEHAVDELLIDLLASDSTFCNHLHICVQAFCDATLKRMNRRYSLAQALGILSYAKAAFPGVCLGSDLITGFPGESREEVERGMEVFSDSGISYLHVFPYSERRETPATRLGGGVPIVERKRRVSRWRALSQRSRLLFLQGLKGAPLEILVETYDDTFLYGTGREFSALKVSWDALDASKDSVIGKTFSVVGVSVDSRDERLLCV